MVQKELKSIRKQKGIFQENMTEILSIHISNYCRKENGKSKIHSREWEKLAKRLDVPVEDIQYTAIPAVGHALFPVTDNKLDAIPRTDLTALSVMIGNLQDDLLILKKENRLLKQKMKRMKAYYFHLTRLFLFPYL